MSDKIDFNPNGIDTHKTTFNGYTMPEKGKYSISGSKYTVALDMDNRHYGVGELMDIFYEAGRAEAEREIMARWPNEGEIEEFCDGGQYHDQTVERALEMLYSRLFPNDKPYKVG